MFVCLCVCVCVCELPLSVGVCLSGSAYFSISCPSPTLTSPHGHSLSVSLCVSMVFVFGCLCLDVCICLPMYRSYRLHEKIRWQQTYHAVRAELNIKTTKFFEIIPVARYVWKRDTCKDVSGISMLFSKN